MSDSCFRKRFHVHKLRIWMFLSSWKDHGRKKYIVISAYCTHKRDMGFRSSLIVSFALLTIISTWFFFDDFAAKAERSRVVNPYPILTIVIL